MGRKQASPKKRGDVLLYRKRKERQGFGEPHLPRRTTQLFVAMLHFPDPMSPLFGKNTKKSRMRMLDDKGGPWNESLLGAPENLQKEQEINLFHHPSCSS